MAADAFPLDSIVEVFRSEADAGRAADMSRYMRDRFTFFGLTASHRRSLAAAVTADWPDPTEDDLILLLAEAWDRDEREVQYFGVDHLVRHRSTLTPAALPPVAEAVTHRSWWDTVDPLASKVVGDIVRRHPGARSTVAAWSRHDDMWLRRTSILHQLTYGTDTDENLLFSICEERAHDTDFFIRKAIGWALRQYARVAPDEVRRFLDDHSEDLLPLSRREAAKHLEV